MIFKKNVYHFNIIQTWVLLFGTWIFVIISTPVCKEDLYIYTETYKTYDKIINMKKI